MSKHTPGPWSLCHHLQSVENDKGCSCGYRGVIYGPDEDVPMAICQPGHDPEPEGQEFTGPQRYSRETELANARLIAAAPDLLEACERAEWWLTTIEGSEAIRSVLRTAISKAEGE